MKFDNTKVVPFRRRRRAPNCSNPMTEEIASRAKTMVIRLGYAQHVAAAKLGVNPGRISEVIHGDKFRDAPFAPLDLIQNERGE